MSKIMGWWRMKVEWLDTGYRHSFAMRCCWTRTQSCHFWFWTIHCRKKTKCQQNKLPEQTDATYYLHVEAFFGQTTQFLSKQLLFQLTGFELCPLVHFVVSWHRFALLKKLWDFLRCTLYVHICNKFSIFYINRWCIDNRQYLEIWSLFKLKKWQSSTTFPLPGSR